MPGAAPFRGATWIGTAPPPVPRPLDPADWARVAARGVPLTLLLAVGFATMLALRLAEAPFSGARRPLSAALPRHVSALACRLIGLRRVRHGAPMAGIGATLANHASWLDVFVLNADQRVIFLAKAEVARWPGIGWLARGAGTLFIRRARAETAPQSRALADVMARGQRPVIFPEGTSSDGWRVLPFKPALLSALRDVRLEGARVQPVTLRYTAPEGADPRFYGWWGDMAFGPHLLRVLAASTQGRVDVIYHAPRAATGDRKTLAADCEADVRQGLDRPVGAMDQGPCP